MTSRWAERVRSSPYYPALSHPVFRQVLPGTAASALGDRMSAVAIAGTRRRPLQVPVMLPG